jgi:hypothetical protein
MMNKTKFFTLACFAVFALVLVTAIGSAASLTFNLVDSPTSVDHDDGTFTVEFSVTNTGAESDVTFTFSKSQGDFNMVFPTNPVHVNTDETKSVVATVTFGEHQLGNIAGTVTADPSGVGDSKTASFSVPINNKAELDLTSVGTLSKTSDGTVTVMNEGNVVLNVKLSENSATGVTFSKTTVNNLAPGMSEDVSVSIPSGTVLNFGSNTVTIKGEDLLNNVMDTTTFTVKTGFCKAGPAGGNLVINDVDISNEGEGDDEEWKLLDIIEVEVEVENTGIVDVDDVIVELGFFDSNGKNQVDEFDFFNADEEEIEVGDINDDDEETVTFRFKVPADFDDGKYDLTVKAYGDKIGEDKECVDTASDFEVDDLFTVIDVEREDDEGKFIAFDDWQFAPTEATCGDTVTLTTDVHNIGDEDQDQVKVIIRNSEMKLDQFVEIRNDLDEGDKETVKFEFVVPQGLSDKIYTIDMTAEYDYNRGSYRESSDTVTGATLKVLGCSEFLGGGSGTGTGKIAAINAVLDSDAVAGEELVVVATITSLRNQKSSFVVDAVDYQSWSSLVGISQRIFELDVGESKEITLTFDVDEDASGEESFLIEVLSGSNTETREISVNIESGAMTGGKSGPSFDALGDNAYLWIIGIVNIVLVILIIVVAVRISRR